jgi:hypothetical protein
MFTVKLFLFHLSIENLVKFYYQLIINLGKFISEYLLIKI